MISLRGSLISPYPASFGIVRNEPSLSFSIIGVTVIILSFLALFIASSTDLDWESFSKFSLVGKIIFLFLS